MGRFQLALCALSAFTASAYLFIDNTTFSLDATFDWDMSNTCASLSAAAYCESSTYLTRTYKGDATGFVATYEIKNDDHDTHGYIGYIPADATIYVVFRGSQTIQNWLDNLDAVLTDYPNCYHCEVHKGFYKAQKCVAADVIAEVQRLKAKYPNYDVVVTGHSLGAAVATFTAIDIIAAGIPARLVNFGSPRVGNDEFAAWTSTYIAQRSRITHHKDMVVHCPMHERFTHISGEWYEDDEGMHECSGYEDPHCSYQWHITNIDDHLTYLGLRLDCEHVSL